MMKYKKSAGEHIFDVVNILFFALFTLICIFPIYYLFINTISSNDLVLAGQVNLFPRGIHFRNYISLLQTRDILQATIVTAGRTVLGTTLMVFASAFVAYILTQQKLFARKFIYRFIIITMYFNAGLIPWFLNMSMLGLTANFWGYILPAIVQPFNIILTKTYIESIPRELEESAFIDGAGHFATYLRIIMPISKPILATIAVFGAVAHWNSFIDSVVLMLAEPKLFTLQHLLYNYLQKATNIGKLASEQGLTGADVTSLLQGRVVSLTIAMVTMIPIVCVYPFMQRYFQKGIMLGAVKG